MSQVIDLPPRVAQAALAATAAPHDRVPRDVGALRFTRPLIMRPLAGRADWLLATRAGRIRHGLHSLTVELELVVWSSQRSELGLRPICSLWTGSPSEACLGAGHDALVLLGQSLTAWAEIPARTAIAEAGTAFACTA